MNILGIESSCDETSVALISNNKLTANLISSQDFHAKYGGVVPELSSRAHLQIIIPLIKDALKKSKLELKDIDVICSTAGPGLIGALLVGLTFAKGLSYSLQKPFIPVDHIEGHIYSGFLMEDKPEFPYLALVVSGGHSLLVLVKSFDELKILGTTIDDAAGEAFDKVSKMLGFAYPGGPQIQKYAEQGDEDRIDFPVAETKSYDFSFSGLKTSVLRYIQKKYPDKKVIPVNDLYDIAASFQNAAVRALILKTKKTIEAYNLNSISLVGGVAANKKLRDEFQKLADKYQKKLVIPDLQYCGDNAAMIAFRGKTLYDSGKKFGLDYSPYPSFRFEKYK
ncbi:MAG: tRNA (adenosine(37)-N6)-threonylcarbamoyltransferase complex transferase subunit TsaD [Ignavibacteriales bacterium]|nr:MAG: tRNA (adenosine(37)-N6)-threonylcarbamoyltransferase complex transferase subunit TsaD [Ignavibacteriales bacterium]